MYVLYAIQRKQLGISCCRLSYSQGILISAEVNHNRFVFILSFLNARNII